MARARPNLAAAVQEILVRHSEKGKRLSFRQAERLTGLAPATVAELAKGNARTPETVRRFAVGMNENVDRLLLLAGFVPEDSGYVPPSIPVYSAKRPPDSTEIEADTQEWLGRFGRALAKMPPGRERDLFKERLSHDTELLEAFLTRLTDAQVETSTDA